MELEESESNKYIDDMISILQDGKELVNNPDAQEAVKKLQALKTEDFIITSQCMEEILRQIKEEMEKVLKSTENLREEYEDLKAKLCDRNEKSNDEHTEMKNKLTELENLMSKEKEGKAETEKEHAEHKMKLTALEVLMAKGKEGKLAAEKEYGELKKNFDKLEALVSEQKEEMKQIKEEKTHKKQTDYEQAKSDLQIEMIERYRKYLLKVPVIPTNQQTNICSFDEIYIRPTLKRDVKGEKGKTEKKDVTLMSEIFTKDGVPLKSIYVLGDAGTGKSSFCNYLVSCWCMAHSDGQSEDDEFGGVNEMKKFEFLFFISLRHNQGINSIDEMLRKNYKRDILKILLKKESAKMIILIDGLDEWSHKGMAYSQDQTMGLPERDVFKKYTIVTTSRPWKIHTLRIPDKEIQQMLTLEGFDDNFEKKMIERTVSNLNSTGGESKNWNDCCSMLRKGKFSYLKQVPIMLKQLICLWFYSKLDKTSRCAVNTEMLELFFTWKRDQPEGTCLSNNENRPVELSKSFADKEKCKSNSHLIYDMSQLAYETLFKCPKEKSLTFDDSTISNLKITNETKKICLKVGILTDDRNLSLSDPMHPKSMFSFIHKSVQEFLAAVNIAINYKTKIDSSNNPGNTKTQRDCIQFVQEVFKKCSTVNEILEQSNVIIMLCGLEPRLATDVSRYIYDNVNEDPLVQRYRRTLRSGIRYHSRYYRFLVDIQNLIFDSMKECNASTVENRPTFHIGDLYIDRFNDSCEIVCSSIDQQQITPDSVRSIYVDYIDTKNVKFSKYLPKFKHLEKIIINYEIEVSSSTESVDTIIDEVNKSVAETIRINTSTLKSLSLSGIGSYNDKLYSLCKNVVHLITSMNNLVAIEMTEIKMSHDDISRFCEFHKETIHLEQIHIDIECECGNHHDVDLSKHQQLQYLDLGSYMCITDIGTVNLEVLKCSNIKSTNYMKIFDSIMKCEKLKKLDLRLDINDQSVSFHTSIRDRLVKVLPLLHNLNKLDLLWLRLTDNIIQNPSEMKSLQDIELYYVMMSLTTWKKFVDSLPSIPHTVNVRLYSCYITGDGEEFNVDWLSCVGVGVGVGGEKGNEAIQYVKDQKQLFNVEKYFITWFEFSTKK